MVDEPLVDLRFALSESPVFVGVSSTRGARPDPQHAGFARGDGGAFAASPWHLEHIVAEAAYRQFQPLYADTSYARTFRYDAGAIADAAVIDWDRGWVSIATSGNLGSPPAPTYFWDVLTEIAQLRLHDGGIAEGQANMDFLLRDRSNPSSVLSTMEGTRTNARLVRTALTREVWEATNVGWMTLRDVLAEPPASRDLPRILDTIRQQTALVRGTMNGTMLRNDIYDFARIGTYLERADNTARILDVKYYVLLPSAAQIGSSLDNVQWETILRCVSAQRAYHWLNQGDVNPQTIADFLILDRRMPRSLAFCYDRIFDNLKHLSEEYEQEYESLSVAAQTRTNLKGQRIETIFDSGLHEFIERFVDKNNALGHQIERDFRFYE